MSIDNYYTVLGVRENASHAEINFNLDPMVGYGETKMFMGIACSWNNADAESKKRWLETGAVPNHTFLISPTDQTCYISNQDVGRFVSKGAVRGQPVFRDNRVVGYRRPY